MDGRISGLVLCLAAFFMIILHWAGKLSLNGWGDWVHLIILTVVVIVSVFVLNNLQTSISKNGSNSSTLDVMRVVLAFVLVVIGIGVVTMLVVINTTLMPVGISAIVGLVGFLAGHTAASVGKEQSEQRILAAASQSKSPNEKHSS